MSASLTKMKADIAVAIIEVENTHTHTGKSRHKSGKQRCDKHSIIKCPKLLQFRTLREGQ